VIVVVGLFVVIVALGVIAALNGGGGQDQFEPGTPEYTVQEYFQAIIDDRPTDALNLVDDELRCDDRFLYELNVSRVVLDSLTYNADNTEATARVQVTQSWGNGIFGPDESTFVETIHLAITDDEGDTGEWRISRSPWPYFECPPEVDR
jgi:hypothetical protein